jgi:hypothetical protein
MPDFHSAPVQRDGHYVFKMVQTIQVIYGKKKEDGKKRKRDKAPIDGVPFKKQSIFYKVLAILGGSQGSPCNRWYAPEEECVWEHNRAPPGDISQNKGYLEVASGLGSHEDFTRSSPCGERE